MSAREDQFLKALKRRGILADTREGQRIQRIFPTQEVIKTAEKRMADFASAELKKSLNAQKAVNEQFNALLAPLRDALKSEQGRDKIAALRKAQETAARTMVGRSQTAYDYSKKMKAQPPQTFITLGPGTTVLSPPWLSQTSPYHFPDDFVYGNNYSDTGIVVFTRDTYNGVIEGNGGNGDAWAALGFIINSPITTPVSIRPYMPFDYQWSDNSNWPVSASTWGGLGILVYEGNGPSII